LAKLSVDKALLKAKSHAKKGEVEEAQKLYQAVLQAFPKNNRAQQGLVALNTTQQPAATQSPPQDTINQLINLYNQEQLRVVVEQAQALTEQYPEAFIIWNILGAANKGLGRVQAASEAFKKVTELNPTYADGFNNLGVTLQDQGKLEEAIASFNKALSLKPDYAQACYNMGNALKDQGKLEEAIASFNKALSLKPDYADAYNNMGNALKDQGKLEEAIAAYNKALSLKPDYAEACNNMGATLQDQGKLEEAIAAYNKALSLKPDYAEACNNMGATLQDQGKLEEAIAAYNKALSLKPDYAEAHRHLSILTKYTADTAQISEVEALLQQADINDADRCNLLYTNAKMQEDLGDLNAAYASYLAGGGLRQKLLKYEFKQDKHFFDQIKLTAPKFKDVALNATGEPITHTPIFILGMPRSGTTLVEQIVSSHSEITGAGELTYVSQFGAKLAAGLTAPTLEAVSAFRARYLAQLAKMAGGRALITDKMPQNFRYIALLCAAFPEAKIVHVQRNAEATCWSNFKHYFAPKSLGYSYDLADTVRYYGLYKELMHFWSQSYSDRIYHMDYDKLTEDQEPETRRLIDHLELNWEEACLAPQNNKRAVKTASQQQVRQKVYKGSSQAWRKYEPYLKDVFDEFEHSSAPLAN
jgi:tetratricopeptide (TPR) repeat protein